MKTLLSVIKHIKVYGRQSFFNGNALNSSSKIPCEIGKGHVKSLNVSHLCLTPSNLSLAAPAQQAMLFRARGHLTGGLGYGQRSRLRQACVIENTAGLTVQVSVRIFLLILGYSQWNKAYLVLCICVL